MPKFVARRIVDDADDDLAAFAQRDAYAKVRDSVKKVQGAVDRIDDPLEVARLLLQPFAVV